MRCARNSVTDRERPKPEYGRSRTAGRSPDARLLDVDALDVDVFGAGVFGAGVLEAGALDVGRLEADAVSDMPGTITLCPHRVVRPWRRPAQPAPDQSSRPTGLARSAGAERGNLRHRWKKPLLRANVQT
ncbi:hypothetical protein FRAHR75_240043 [Frankia sp. Hr75.2]|nr:hypothetical protein FRAHR75_240043 [Frankia sp. Hr75.2]